MFNQGDRTVWDLQKEAEHMLGRTAGNRRKASGVVDYEQETKGKKRTRIQKERK